ncbi:hypothetical protein KUL42_43830 [Alteromonas sp. KUL42]|uniref:hypothetical protein n=1 Tax=Alteromonas sp. KUL42 TaxID=2480797 RepID=UPI00103658A9|nr:hypothetical protein [Alteromonas sp. KUL42]TAP29637.1 hypothetical protein EYR97_21775 [Alteromonas sp. KUL42]GEA09622.1 hypothetical protein KUL42_43830 [Alteromonas sp. KUL42]
MEEVAEGIGRFFLNILKWVFIDAILEFFIRGLGYISLKIVTFGKYPRKGRDEGRSVIAGFVTLALILVLIGMTN